MSRAGSATPLKVQNETEAMKTLIMLMMAIALVQNNESAQFFRDRGWHYVGFSRASLRKCPQYINESSVTTKVISHYRRDPLSKVYSNIKSMQIYCLENSKLVIVLTHVVGIIDTEPVFILTDKGDLVGKFLLSPYGDQAWS